MNNLVFSFNFIAQANSKSENAVDDSDSDEDDDEYDDENEIEINSGNELRDKDKIIAEEIDGLNNRIIDRKFHLTGVCLSNRLM